MNTPGTRYQQGSLTSERRRNGTSLWLYHWREVDGTGKLIRRKKIVGTKQQFPTKAAALRAVDGLKADINAEAATAHLAPMSVTELIEHYRLKELCETNKKTVRTKEVYAHQLLRVIAPRWGSFRLKDVKPIAVEQWLSAMPVAPSTKAKTRAVLWQVYSLILGRHCFASDC